MIIFEQNEVLQQVVYTDDEGDLRGIFDTLSSTPIVRDFFETRLPGTETFINFVEPRIDEEPNFANQNHRTNIWILNDITPTWKKLQLNNSDSLLNIDKIYTESDLSERDLFND